MPRPLHGLRYHALMTRAGAGNSARDNFAALGDELGAEPPQDHLFVIDECRFIYAKHTNFATWFAKLAWLAARFAG